MIKKVNLPMTKGDILSLHCGDELFISGVAYMARDMAHQMLTTLINDNENLPIDLNNSVIYYAGPTMSRPGSVIGAAGPTTSARMDQFMPALMSKGAIVSIGKGPRSESFKQLVTKYQGLYLTTVGGAASYLSKHIKTCRVVAFPEFGPEALYEITFNDFYVVVTYDPYGGDLYKNN